MSAEMDLLNEINQRAIRVESRMVQLGDYVGANLRTKMRVDVRDDRGEVWVEVDAVDVSMSRIHTALREASVHAGVIPVLFNGKTIATVYPDQFPQKGSA
jgi:hypothetical protein